MRVLSRLYLLSPFQSGADLYKRKRRFHCSPFLPLCRSGPQRVAPFDPPEKRTYATHVRDEKNQRIVRDKRISRNERESAAFKRAGIQRDKSIGTAPREQDRDYRRLLRDIRSLLQIRGLLSRR